MQRLTRAAVEGSRAGRVRRRTGGRGGDVGLKLLEGHPRIAGRQGTQDKPKPKHKHKHKRKAAAVLTHPAQTREVGASIRCLSRSPGSGSSTLRE
jgi:hypothetical protein